MRDPNRIPEMISELEKIWKQNPDFRLGQLMCVFTKPKQPCHEMFNVEDDVLVEGMKAFVDRFKNKNNQVHIPYWSIYPDITRIEVKEISLDIIERFVNVLKENGNELIVTPCNLLKLNYAPIEDKRFMSGQKERIDRIKELLTELEIKGVIYEVERGYRAVGLL